MKSAVLIFASRVKPKAQKARKTLIHFLKRQGVEIVDVSGTEGKLKEGSLRAVRLGVVIGGDGTFLTVVRRLQRKDAFPLLGVNLGTLGFITEVGPEDMCSAVKDALAGKYTEENRPLLSVELWRKGKKVQQEQVFNDAVITKDARTSMLQLKISVEGQVLSQINADGVILATATGSTAYALSAGGPIVHPQVNGALIVPLSSHSLTTRPLVLPLSTTIEVLAEDFRGGASLIFDGQLSSKFLPGDKVRIRQSENSLRMIHSPKNQWPETIRTKLGME